MTAIFLHSSIEDLSICETQHSKYREKEGTSLLACLNKDQIQVLTQDLDGYTWKAATCPHIRNSRNTGEIYGFIPPGEVREVAQELCDLVIGESYADFLRATDKKLLQFLPLFHVEQLRESPEEVKSS